MVAHQNLGVDGDGPGAGLGDGRQVQHFFFLDPVQFLHEAFPHQGDNNEPAAEGAGAQLKGRKKQLPVFIFLVFLVQ